VTGPQHRPHTLLVFAQTPPPYHGQSYMVQVLLDGLATAPPDAPAATISCLHVNARYSADLQDIGGFRIGKVLSLFRYCAQAIAIRLRHGVRTLYFVPSPPRRLPLIRDMLTLLLLRPFFPRVIFHWHAAGLGSWLASQPAWTRIPAQALLGRADLSIALAKLSEPDARLLDPECSVVVPYGIADPFPDFATRVAPRRAARAMQVAAALEGNASSHTRVRVLFMAMCTREKGLFDAVAAIAGVNESLSGRGCSTRFELHVAGDFPDLAERAEFDAIVSDPAWEGLCRYHGFVSGEEKRQLLEQSDMMLFPTFYRAESFPVVVLEAMAAGLPVVASAHRAIPEMLPVGYPGIVAPHDVTALQAKLSEIAGSGLGSRLREHYLSYFTLERYVARMAKAIADVAQP
jgi:glycosyltransferase involved in cell wall biosynthesis